MADFQRGQLPFVVQGVNVRLPADRVPQGQLPFGENIRSYLLSTVEGRPGLTAISGVVNPAPVHSILRLNDPTPGASQPFTRIVGSGTKIYAGAVPGGGNIDTGYSGNPLSFCEYRPDQSIAPFAYIADSLRMSRVNVAGQRSNWGIPQPQIEPTVVLDSPRYNVIDNFENVGGWVPVASDTGSINQITRIADTIDTVLYDQGSTGWCLMAPHTPRSAYQPGMVFIGQTNPDQVVIQAVKAAISDTTVAHLAYDSGSTGLCSVAPIGLLIDTGVTQVRDLVDSLIQIDSEFVRILSVTTGPDGSWSFRCNTTGTHSAGSSIHGVMALRMFTGPAHSAGEVWVTHGVTAVITQPAGAASFQGGIQKIANFNFLSVQGRPAGPDDYIHVSVLLSNVQVLVEGRVWFDVDSQSTDFSHNYYFWAFRPPDISSALQESFDPTVAPTPMATAIQGAVVQAQYDDASPLRPSQQAPPPTSDQPFPEPGEPGGPNPILPPQPPVGSTQPTSQQTGFGVQQWLELKFRFSDLTRVGTDTTRTMANVGGIRITLSLTAGATVDASSIWVGSSYGPDVADIGQLYQYRYRGRSSKTGARSNPSPPCRTGVAPLRQAVLVSGPQHPDPQVDFIDIEQYGGNITEWRFVGTVPNTSPWSFSQQQDDTAVLQNPASTFDSFQPWPSVDRPRSGLVNCYGTTIRQVSGDLFNTAWGAGTAITVNGVLTTLFSSPISGTQVQVTDNIGSAQSVPYLVQEATLLAQPWPIAFVFSDGFIFGLGDPNQPGTLGWTNRYLPDQASDANTLEITDPSDPLMNGGEVNGFPFVFSRTRITRVVPDYQHANTFVPQLLYEGHGPIAPWAFGVGPVFCFVSDDGIYEFDGVNPPVSISDDQLYPLFPHDGQPGFAANGLFPPDYTKATQFRVTYGYGQWFFDYVDTNNVQRTLVYDRGTKAWWPDVFAASVAPVVHVPEFPTQADGDLLAGGTNGKLYARTGATDDGIAIPSTVEVPSADGGDLRVAKVFGDGMLDVDPAGVNVTVTPGVNAYATFLAPQVVTGVGRQQFPIDVAGGDGVTALNFGAKITWPAHGPRLFAWGWSFVPKVELTSARATDWTNGGLDGAKFVQGVLIRADTQGANKTVQVQYDGGGLATPPLVLNNNGEDVVPYSFNPPIPYAHLMRMISNDSVPWRLLDVKYIFEPAPESVLMWQTQGTTFDLPGYKHAYLFGVAHSSTADLTLTVTIDGVVYNYVVPNSGGLYLKTYVTLQAVKGKIFALGLQSSEPFQVFQKDLELWVMPWKGSTPYQMVSPMGGPHRAVGAQI